MKRIPNDTKERLVNSYLSSGLSRLDFCKQKGISISSLQRWLGLFKGQSNRGNTKTVVTDRDERFVEAVVRDHGQQPQLMLSREMLTIRTPSGYVIEVPV
jgi:transposase-like protein